MTLNENPFELPPKISRRSNDAGLDLLADVVENSSIPAAPIRSSKSSTSKPVPQVKDPHGPFDESDDSKLAASSSPPKKKPKNKSRAHPPKSPSTIPAISQDDPVDSYPSPKTPSSKKSSSLTKTSKKTPLTNPDLIVDKPDRTFESPQQFFSRMKKALPPKECPKMEIYKLPFPLDSEMQSKFDAIDCDDWSDSFTRPFHLSVENDLDLWNALSSKFDDVTSLSEFREFLEVHSNRHPLAFLGFDRHKNPVIFHNVFVSPDSGSILAPDPVFLCFSKDSFDVPPGTFDSDELASILKSLDYMYVPTFDEIMSACIVEDTNSLSGLSVSPAKFDGFAPYLQYPDLNSDSPEDVQFRKDHLFECKSIVLLPPSISGDLIQFLDPSSSAKNDFASEGGPKSSVPKISSLIAFIFSKILTRWRRSFEFPSCRPSSTKFSVSDPHCIRFGDLVRFLWGINRGKIIVDDIFIDHPSDFGSAMNAVEFYFKTSLPDRSLPMYSTKRGPRPPPSERSGSFSPSKSRYPSRNETLDVRSTPDDAKPISKDVLYLTTQLSKSMAEQLSRSISDQRDQLSQAIVQQSSILKTQEERLDHFKSFTVDMRNAIIFGQVGPHSTSLPIAPTEKAKEIFKQKSTHNLYTTIHSQVFRRSDNTCFLIFGQVGVIQKFGLRWRSDEHPGGFSPFSFDPNNHSGASNQQALDHDIHQDIFESSLRHSNGLSTKEMKDIFTDDKLFFPLSLDHYGTQLRSYLCLAEAIWGSDSFIVLNIQKMYDHLLRHRRIYIANQADDSSFLSRLLFSLDNSVQNFIADNLEDATDLEDISGDALDYHTNKLCNKVVSKEDICRMPRFLNAAVQAKYRNQNNPNHGKSNSQGNGKRNGDSKLPGPPPGPLRAKRGRDHDTPRDTSAPDPVRPTFDYPSSWKLPSDVKYGKAFPRSVLGDVPSITVDGSSRQFCVKFFSLQICRGGNSCYFSHADPSQHGKRDELDKFFEDAYARAKRNS